MLRHQKRGHLASENTTTIRRTLAGVDMQTDAAGVRRSNRQRVRPREYWRDKVVYSRKHASLPTVHHEVHSMLPRSRVA